MKRGFMTRLSARPPVDRKFIALHEEVHQRVMRIAKKTGATGNDVIVALLAAVDLSVLEKKLIDERTEREAVRAKLKQQQAKIMGKLSKLSPDELDKLLESL
jgi:hypothetical protein